MDDPEILGTSGGRDDRGLISLTIPYFARTLEEAITVGPSVILGTLEEQSRTFRAGPSGHFDVEVTYEGDDGNPDSQKINEAVYSAQGSFREEPIEAHPKIKELMEKYNGVEDRATGRIHFDATLAGAAGVNALAAESGINKEERNPMAGVEKFMALEIVWTRSYIQKLMPATIFAKVGRVIKSPPGNPPKISGRNSWLIMPPKVTKRGRVFEIEEQWTLLPEGSPEAVYNL